MSISSSYQEYDNECCGPRPPVPGKESCSIQMTEGLQANMLHSTPSYLNWARTLSHLLEDRDGVELFKKYVEEEVPAFNDHLNFYFACEGLKQQTDPEKIKQIIQAIYRFLRKSKLCISEDVRRTIKANLKNENSLSPNIFDTMQKQVENTIRDNIYPSFLCSEMYILYIQQKSIGYERIKSSQLHSACKNGIDIDINRENHTCGAYTLPNATIRKTPNITSSTIASNSSVIDAFVNMTVTSSNTSISNGSCNTGGSGPYGPSTSASSSGSASATDTIPRNSALPTLHEDTELQLNDDLSKLRIEGDHSAIDMPIRLTRDLLLATQNRRLEIRPSGALGYVYSGKSNSSYVPNSRIESERASISSGARTDSDTMSLSSCSIDGRPYSQRRQDSNNIRQNAIANKEVNTFQVIPRTQRLHMNEHRPLREAELVALLIPKLEEVKRKQEIEERARSEFLTDDNATANDKAFAQAIREKFAIDEDNDQDILDQHVSRVWKDQTPHRSPGTMSPCPPLPSRRRPILVDSVTITDSNASITSNNHALKLSKPISDSCSSTRKLTNKWPSMNTDSGISSLFSSDTLLKYKDNSLHSGASLSSKVDETTKRRLDDETRRSRRYNQQYLQQTAINNNNNNNNNHVQNDNTPPPLPAKPQETTTVVFSFCDEEYPYRTKIPGIQPTLKQFKDYLPKKGNFRFFFKAHCEDADSPVIQEEIVNDSDILPLFEGKVMGLVKPCD